MMVDNKGVEDEQIERERENVVDLGKAQLRKKERKVRINSSQKCG